MLGWKIYKHAATMLWSNLGTAFRMLLLPTAVLLAVTLGAVAVLDESASDSIPFAILAVSIIVPVMIFVYAVLLVAWHRFIPWQT